jgi:DNA protecting protein DprA
MWEVGVGRGLSSVFQGSEDLEPLSRFVSSNVDDCRVTDASKANDQDLSPELLAALRDAAQDLVNPWPKDQPFHTLSKARLVAIERAARQLLSVLRDTPSSTPRQKAPTRTKGSPAEDLARIDNGLESRVGVRHSDLMFLFALDAIRGFGPQKFKSLAEADVTPEQAVRNPLQLPLPGKIGDQLRQALAGLSEVDLRLAEERAARQMVVADENAATILTYSHPAYPQNVLDSSNPIPILYARGDLSVLRQQAAVACVGSREIAPPYSDLQAKFVKHAASSHVVVSGFALGADTIAHSAAVEAGGRTICVMPGGLDRPFPPENKNLFERFLATRGVVFVSEFPFGTGASSMNLRKRNKLIVAAARGVLVGQSARNGGAMNAFKFGIEQRKPIATFADDGTERTSGNRDIATSAKGFTFAFSMRTDTAEWGRWLSQLF